MSILFALKMVCDLCFYFTFAGAVSALFGGNPAIAAVPVFGVSAFLCAVLRREGNFRLAPLPLLFLCLPFAPMTPPNVLLIIPPAAYLFFSAYRLDEPDKRSFEYKERFRLFLKLCLPFAAVLVYITLAGRASVWDACVPFAFVFFAGAVTLMRLTRHDTEALSGARLKTVIPVALFSLAGAFLSLRAAYDALFAAAGFVYSRVIVRILELVFAAIAYLLRPLFALAEGASYLPERPGEAYDILSPGETGDISEFFKPSERFFVTEILPRLLMLAASVLAVMLIIRLLRRLAASGKEARAKIGGPGAVPLPGSWRPPRQRLGGAGGIRGAYRGLMELCQSRGLAAAPHLTSENYEEFSSGCFGSPEEAAEFRSIYVRFRYGEKPAGPRDVKRMRRILARFRKTG